MGFDLIDSIGSKAGRAVTLVLHGRFSRPSKGASTALMFEIASTSRLGDAWRVAGATTAFERLEGANPSMQNFFRSLIFAAAAMVSLSIEAPAQTTPADQTPPCAIGGGSSNVFVEGRRMLRLSDVAGCPDLRYDILPGIFVNGEPAITVSPNGKCIVGGAASVTANDAPVVTQGDVVCPK